ncbi:DUF1489 family protein [Halovulum sp. GXIMD14793]
MIGALHILKLSVGSESVETLYDWQCQVIARNAETSTGPYPTHVTRMWPKQTDTLLQGGSIYWVIRGMIQARQAIRGFEERFGEDGIRRCAIVLDPQLHRTAPRPHRAFQGWRYLKAKDAPADLSPFCPGEPTMPVEMQEELARLGVL